MLSKPNPPPQKGAEGAEHVPEVVFMVSPTRNSFSTAYDLCPLASWAKFGNGIEYCRQKNSAVLFAMFEETLC